MRKPAPSTAQGFLNSIGDFTRALDTQIRRVDEFTHFFKSISTQTRGRKIRTFCRNTEESVRLKTSCRRRWKAHRTSTHGLCQSDLDRFSNPSIKEIEKRFG